MINWAPDATSAGVSHLVGAPGGTITCGDPTGRSSGVIPWGYPVAAHAEARWM